MQRALPVRLVRLARQGPAGPIGPAGADGAQGDPGPAQGPAGPAGSTSYDLVSATAVFPRSAIAPPLSATCTPGDVAVSGGYSAKSPNVFVFASQPGGSPVPTSWVVTVEFGGGGGAAGLLRTVTVYAVCLDI